ncbi:hypothetical protein [Parafrigoribacterium soli]|uniref:hypothetical protein n=1 Tax=Parafrigoribacterium soli TaxID=3144663 RepID=UPI0032EC8838
MLLGVVAIIGGGLLSAVTASVTNRQLAWLVAYLVLVVGIAQIGLGAGQAWLARRSPAASTMWGQFVLFLLGNAGVAIGTMLAIPVLVDVGGALLVAALALFLAAVVRSSRGGWLRWLYLALVATLLVSIPIGLLLAQLRAARA